ncbi:hypothetical protein THIOM_001648 [Candidatus Thiomargarita nelsonii]|uniref:Uncharacterized protein n=1 Tax=Candidatus Thiomargarita nelsonii TaxID=1003181 RepID=A0A176S361_9GAMM|nr:hypothetical protein THIOM_001648 [Candidatus Thiomargarita nelsonii]
MPESRLCKDPPQYVKRFSIPPPFCHSTQYPCACVAALLKVYLMVFRDLTSFCHLGTLVKLCNNAE